ncbi:hypothetical protein ACFL21_03620 [Patescibacteria group bacterium]
MINLNGKVLMRLLAVVLAVFVLSSFAGCKEKEEVKDDEKETTEKEEVVEETTVELDKQVYETAESMTVDYKIIDEVDGSAWMGIVPSDTPHGKETDGDAADITYQKFQGKMEGTKTFNAPDEAGEYDVRIYSSDAQGEEVISVSFKVEAAEEEEVEEEEPAEDEDAAEGEEEEEVPTLSIESEAFIPGEAIEVSYTTPEGFDTSAWVGIIPSDIEHGKEEVNDNHDLEYRYLHGEPEGTLIFTAPSEPGSYDFRMNESDKSGAKEVASISFKVE